MQADGDDPSGSVVDLVDGFADHLDAEPEWTVGSEETLVGMLERGDLDLIAGGITSDTPGLRERAFHAVTAISTAPTAAHW